MKKKQFFRADKTIILAKVKEAFLSIMPISLIILILCLTVVPVDSGQFLAFVLGSVCVVVGMGLFTLGADTAMTPIGEYVGTSAMRTKKLWFILPICFIVGVMITISEPDLQVLGTQLKNAVDSWTLILVVGVGVGVFLAIAFLRVVLNISLKYILLFFYTAVFVLSFFVPSAFVPLAFDSGGVTTGPMSVPFIIAIGTGVASLRSDKNAETDGFGFTALCSIGPILSVMILGIIVKPTEIIPSESEIQPIINSKDILVVFGESLPHYLKEVAVALLPIVAFYFVSQLFGQKVHIETIIKILVGVFYTYVGLVLFLIGVNVGFLPVGSQIGRYIGEMDKNWIIVPLGMIIGFFVVAAEPAVHVLTKQVYEITGGAIPKKALSLSLMIGVAVSVGLAMLRLLLDVNIMYFLIPGYLIALVLTFIVPDIFTAIAFDSGGVASGAMTASFLMPLALGVCSAVGGDIATQGFGVVAMVAMTPLITIQILGLVYKIKTAKLKTKQVKDDTSKEDIIE